MACVLVAALQYAGLLFAREVVQTDWYLGDTREIAFGETALRFQVTARDHCILPRRDETTLVLLETLCSRDDEQRILNIICCDPQWNTGLISIVFPHIPKHWLMRTLAGEPLMPRKLGNPVTL